MTQRNHTGIKTFPLRMLILSVSVTLLLISFLGWLIFRSYADFKRTQSHDFKLEHLSGIILQLDEALTMSTHMAAVTGDLRWEQRYQQLLPQLEAAIRDAKIEADEASISAAIAQVESSGRELASIETRIFSMVRKDNRDDAESSLSSEEFVTQKRIYREGIQKLYTGLEVHGQSALRTQNRRQLSAVVSILLVVPLSLFVWLYTLRTLKKHIALREQAEANIRKHNEFFKIVIDSLPYPFLVVDTKDYSIKTANAAASTEGTWEGLTCHVLTHHRDTPCDGENHICSLKEIEKTRKSVVVEHIHYDKEGNKRQFEVHGYPILDEEGNVIQMIEYSIDISDRRLAEEERERLIADLRTALDKVKTLSGFLPICASCKKIRDDKGYWNQIEAYIRDHSEAEFSHGICPECAQKLYPGYSNKGT